MGFIIITMPLRGTNRKSHGQNYCRCLTYYTFKYARSNIKQKNMLVVIRGLLAKKNRNLLRIAHDQSRNSCSADSRGVGVRE